MRSALSISLPGATRRGGRLSDHRPGRARVGRIRRQRHPCARERAVASGRVGPNGVVGGLDGPEPLFGVGVYELRLHVGDYFRMRGTVLPEPAFMDVQVFRFAVADTARHYHLPVKLTPWGMSCFRGA